MFGLTNTRLVCAAIEQVVSQPQHGGQIFIIARCTVDVFIPASFDFKVQPRVHATLGGITLSQGCLHIRLCQTGDRLIGQPLLDGGIQGFRQYQYRAVKGFQGVRHRLTHYTAVVGLSIPQVVLGGQHIDL